MPIFTELTSRQILSGMNADGVRSGARGIKDYEETQMIFNGNDGAVWAKPGRRAAGMRGGKLPGAAIDRVAMPDFGRKAGSGVDPSLIPSAYFDHSLDGGDKPVREIQIRGADAWVIKRFYPEGVNKPKKAQEKPDNIFRIKDIDSKSLDSASLQFFYHWSGADRKNAKDGRVHWLTYCMGNTVEDDRMILRDGNGKEYGISVPDFWNTLKTRPGKVGIKLPHPQSQEASKEYLAWLNNTEIAGEKAEFAGIHVTMDLEPDLESLDKEEKANARRFIAAWGKVHDGKREKPRTITYIKHKDGLRDLLVVPSGKGYPVSLPVSSFRQMLHLDEAQVVLHQPLDQPSQQEFLGLINAMAISGHDPRFDRVEIRDGEMQVVSLDKIICRPDIEILPEGLQQPARLMVRALINGRPSNGDGRQVVYEMDPQEPHNDKLHASDKGGKSRFLPVWALDAVLHLGERGIKLPIPETKKQAERFLVVLGGIRLTDGKDAGITSLVVKVGQNSHPPREFTVTRHPDQAKH